MATANHSLNVWSSDSDLLTNFRSQLTANLTTLDTALGLFSSLPTTAKTSLVAAILEVYNAIKATADGSSGADYIGATAVATGFGSTVQSNMEAIYASIVAMVLGEIPNDSLTSAKLSFSPLTELPTAGGTATALTVVQKGFSLAAGAKCEFVAASNNSGAATTVNVNSTGVKSIYKPGGTSAPTLIAGKAYTIWYSTSGGNFFLKASATGDAVAENVLAGKIFSNDTDTDLTGTMTNNSGDTYTTGSSVSGTTLKLKPARGFYDGDDDYVTITDADFVAGNILSGVNLFGLAGTYSNIKSIQRGTFAWGNFTTKNVSISPINLSNSIVMLSDTNYRGGACYYRCTANLTSSTNIEFKIIASMGSDVANYNWTVVEFNNVKSKQSGSVAITSTSKQTIAINSVNIYKSMLFSTWRSYYSGGDEAGIEAFETSTQISYQFTNAAETDVEYQIIEFY